MEDQSRESGRADHHPGSRDRPVAGPVGGVGGSRKTRLFAELHRGSDPSRVRASGTAYSSRLHVLGAGILASQGPAQILFEQRQKVLVAEWPAGTLMRAEGFQLLVPDGAGQQTAPVGGHLQQRSDLHQGVIMPSQVSRRAAPAITAWCRTNPARTGLSSTYRAAVRRWSSSMTNEAKRHCHRCPRQPSRKLIHRVYRRCASPMARRRLSADCGTTIR